MTLVGKYLGRLANELIQRHGPAVEHFVKARVLCRDE